jgi:hypothetical protein
MNWRWLGTLLDLKDEPPDDLSHLLEAGDTDGLDVEGDRRQGGGPGGLVDEALRAIALVMY